MKGRATALLAAAMLVAACSNTDQGVTSGESTQGSGAPATSAPTDTTDTTGSTPTPNVGDLEWTSCDDPIAADDDSLECATLTVPLSYDQPDGDTIDLALIRVPASGNREGAILFNPGGPGGSGFDYVAQGGSVISTTMGLDDFDLIGFDPRGVDRSGGIRCIDDATQDKYLYVDTTPDTPEEQAEYDASTTAFVDGCTANYGDTLGDYSTEATARDMDAIRAALGDDQISYLGISYGTYLGGVYATLFPDRVRAMVLDSAYSPEGDSVEEQWSTQLVGFEKAFDNWAAWCTDTPECAFRTDDVGARWDALYDRLDATPIPASDGRLANQSVMDTATSAALYSDSQWPVLGKALADAEAGDPTQLFALADEYNGRNPDGTFNTLFQSFTVIQCASGIEAQLPDDPDALAAQLRADAPRFAADLTGQDIIDSAEECRGLVDPPVTPFAVDYRGEAPVVVIGGLNDPATPIRWAEELTAAMGPNARLVPYEGEGHGQLLSSTCVTDIEAAVLADLTLPDEGTTCSADPPVERPDWWGDIPTPNGVGDPVDLPALAAALGVTPSIGYGEFRTTTLDETAAADAYEQALTDAGFESAGEQDLGIDGTVYRVFLSPGFDALAVVTIGPDALASDDLAGAAGEVDPGTTVVLLLYVPT
jgi:pimeloyl-ACP methyl ester carboxylesterase/predicted small secreted protein